MQLRKKQNKEKRLLLEIVSAIDVQYLQELYSFFFRKKKHLLLKCQINKTKVT